MTGVVSLGEGDSMRTVGRNKSGKPWKKCSERTSFTRPYMKRTFAEKKAESERLKKIRERANAITEERIEKVSFDILIILLETPISSLD